MTKHYHHILVLILALSCMAACGSASTPTALSTALPSSTPLPASRAEASAVPATSTAPAPAPEISATPEASIAPSTVTNISVTPTLPPISASATPDGGANQIAGTVVRFTTGSTAVDVTIGEDTPAVRDFLSMLPLTMTFEEFNGREKISYLPRKLAITGSPGSDPEDGDLIYYTPWGNLGFYYNTAGIGYSDQTLHLGTYQASRDQLNQLEGQPVTVAVVR